MSKVKKKILLFCLIINMMIESLGSCKSTNKIENEYIEELDNYKVTYNNEDILLNGYIEPNINKCNFKYDDIKDILDMVLSNSIDFENNSDIQKAITKIENTQDISLEETIYVLLYNYLNDISKDTNNINEDMHAISNIAIMFYDFNNNALGLTSMSTKTIFLNKETLEKMYLSGNITSIQKILYHELNHIRQAKCVCRQNIHGMYDILDYSIDGEYVIPCFLIEASADSKLYYQEDNSYIKKMTDINQIFGSYIEYRKYEAYLSMLTIFNEENMTNYYNAIYDANYNKLANIYHVSNEELYKILYSMDINFNRLDIEYTTSKSALIDVYRLYLINIMKNSNNLSYIDALVLQQFFKEGMLSSLTNWNNIDLTDIFNLNNSERNFYDEQNIIDLINIDNIFNEYLKLYYSIDDNDIKNITNNELYNHISSDTYMYLAYDSSIDTMLNPTNIKIKASALKLIKKYPNIIFNLANNHYAYKQDIKLYKEKILEYKKLP